MNVIRLNNSSKILRLISILNCLILLNYYSWFFFSSELFRSFLFFGILLVIISLLKDMFKNNFYLFFLIILLTIFILGSPSFHWDARSIWLFHGKKLFYDKNFYYLAENYGKFYFNSYPVLGPSLSATIAETFGYWNEIFPKLFCIIISIPGLIYLNSFFYNKLAKIIFIAIILFILEKSLIIGEMDGLVSIYFVVCTLLLFQIFFKNYPILKNNKIFFSKTNKYFFYFFAFTNFSIFLLLKKECLIYLFIIFLSFFFSKFFLLKKKKFNYINVIILFLSLINIFVWEFFLRKNNISLSIHPGISNLYDVEFFKIFFSKVLNFKNYFIIANGLFLNKSFFISLLFTTFVISFFILPYKNLITINKKIFIIIILIIFFYLGFLFTIYLLSSWDLEWHIETSAARVMLPLSLLISFLSLLIIQNRLTKKF